MRYLLGVRMGSTDIIQLNNISPLIYKPLKKLIIVLFVPGKAT